MDEDFLFFLSYEGDISEIAEKVVDVLDTHIFLVHKA